MFPRLVRTLSDLAREELEHVQQVHDELQRRGIRAHPPGEDPYAIALRKSTQGDTPKSEYGALLDRLSIGALIPNFREPNPARFVSGFGGTLCLISSFLYILLSIVVLVLPTWWRFRTGTMPPINIAPNPLPDLLALLGVFGLTLLFGVLPFTIAKNQTKKLEYLRLL